MRVASDDNNLIAGRGGHRHVCYCYAAARRQRGNLLGIVLLLSLGVGIVQAQPQFTEVTDQAGLTLTHQTTQPVVDVNNGAQNTVDHVPGFGNSAHLFSTWLTGGVAGGDYDGDGWPDLFVIGGDAGQSKLFRNLGDGTFDDVTSDVGLDTLSGRIAGAVFADYDGDGDLDLFLGGALEQQPYLLRNDVNTQGTFTNAFGIALADYQPQYSPNAWGGAFGDFNNDQCLDLLIPRSMTPDGPTPTIKTPEGSTQQLWQNDCDGTFTDVSLSSGISPIFDVDTFPSLGRDQTFAGNFSDINNDGWPDILYSGDIGTDLILINQQNGQFVNMIDRFIINDKNAMGVGVGDVNNDGNIDWFTSNIGMPNPGNRIFYGNGDGTFINGTFDGGGQQTGLREGHWGWATCLIDVNMDGNLDIFHVNGFYFPNNGNPDSPTGRYDGAPAVLFINNGDETFTESAALYGLDDHGEGRGVSCSDFDRDGDTDIAISNHKGPFRFYRNDLPAAQRNFITVQLQGLAPNTEGIGAKIRLRSQNPAEPGEWLHEVRAGNNFLSSNVAEATFGLGDRQGPFDIDIRWGDAHISELRDLGKNQFVSVPASEATILRQGFEDTD